MGQTLFEIQKQFNNLLLNGVGYNILNNPIISWDNGFIKTLTAVCMLIAIVDAASKIADHKIFLTSVLKLAFAFVLVLMNFGQINPRSVFNVGIQGSEYDYLTKPEPKSAQELRTSFNITSARTVPTLDREIFNGLQRYFDGVATLIGTSAQRKVSNAVPGYQMDLQEAAMQSTLFFLAQVKLAKIACLSKENSADYGACLGQYIPVSPPIDQSGQMNPSACKSGKCKSEGEEAVQQGDTAGTGQNETSSWSSKIFSSGTLDALSKLVEIAFSAYATMYLIFTDFLFMITLPVVLWLLEFVRTLVAMYIYIIYGFQAVGLLVFAKILSPLFLIESKRREVISAYQNVFALTLFGFVSQLFVFFSTILTLGLRDATFQAIAPSVVSSGPMSSASSVDFTANLGTLSILVYTSMFVIMMIQIQALTKIIPACKALMNFSVSSFVAIGEELGAAGVKMGLMVAGAAVGGVTLGGAAIAGMAAKGGLATAGGAALKGSFGKTAQTLAGKAQSFGNKAQRGAMRMAGGAIENVAGTEAADKFRFLLGGQQGAQSGQAPSILGKKAGNNNGDMSNLRDNKKDGGDGGGNDDGGGSSGGGSSNKPNNDGGGKEGASRGGPYKNNKSEKAGNSSSSASSEGGSSDENPFSKESKKAYRNMPSGRKAGFLNNKYIKAGLGGMKAGMNLASGTLGVMEAGASGNFKNPLSSIGTFKDSFSKGAGTNIAGAYQSNVVDAMNKSFDDIAANPEMMDAIREYNISIDNVSYSDRIARQQEMQAKLNAQNFNIMSEKEKDEFSVLTSKASSPDSMSEDEMNKLYGYANNYELDMIQGEMLKKAKQNEFVQDSFKTKKSQETAQIQQYLSAPTAQNSIQLSSAISSGSISKQTLKDNSKQLEKISNEKTKEAMNDLTNDVYGVNLDKLNDPKYANSTSVQSVKNRVNAALSNANSRAILIGANNAVALEKMGIISGEDLKTLMKFNNVQEAMDAIKEFRQDIQPIIQNRKFNVSEDTIVKFDSNLEPMGIFKANDKIAEKLFAKDMNPSLIQKMEKYKKAMDIMNDNPEKFSDIRDQEKQLMNIIANLL
jgi:hypothetical protein